jgi:putative flippase GtrA
MSLAQFARYGAVGVVGTGAHVGTTAALVETLGTPPVAASVVGFCFALLLSFVLNARWVFTGSRRGVSSLARYCVVSLLGLGLNVAIMAVTTEVLSLHYFVGLAAGIAIVPVVNFTLNRRWSFR